MYNIKNGLDYQKKRAKRKDTGDEKFLTAVVNFFIMTLIVFCIVKAMNAAGEIWTQRGKGAGHKGVPIL